MNPLNSVIIEGNVKEFTCNLNPINAATPHGILILECSRQYKDIDGILKDEISAFRVHLFGRLCKFLDNYYKQGKNVQGIRVVGRLKLERWTDSTGKSHSAISIIAEHIEIKAQDEQEEDSEG